MNTACVLILYPGKLWLITTFKKIALSIDSLVNFMLQVFCEMEECYICLNFLKICSFHIICVHLYDS